MCLPMEESPDRHTVCRTWAPTPDETSFSTPYSTDQPLVVHTPSGVPTDEPSVDEQPVQASRAFPSKPSIVPGRATIAPHPAGTSPTTTTENTRRKKVPFNGPFDNKFRVRMVKPLVAVAGDSMLKRMTSYQLSQECRGANSLVRPFVGARVEDMHDYIEPNLRADPDVILLHIGTNNISDPMYDGELVLVDKINNLIEKIEDRLPHVIIILSLPVCRNDSYYGRVLKFNEKIIEYCEKKLINYIANGNISGDHLNRGGLHLNAHGCKILYNNITSFINFIIHTCFPIPG